MKKWTIQILLLMFSFNFCSSQNQTFEYAPKFDKETNAFFTEIIVPNIQSQQVDFIGISAYTKSEEQVDLFFRLKKNQVWSDWTNFYQVDKNKLHQRAAYTAEIISESFDAIQIRSNQFIDDQLYLRIFYATEKASSFIDSQKSMSCELTDFCDRDCWCSNCPTDPTPEFTVPTHIIVHHSAGFNQSNNFASVVEFYWDLHVNTNGWDDIGYNWLIDANGVLYQGRPDGYQGAHFSCINENTVGICMIGDFTAQTPSIDAQQTLVELLAYECTEHQIDAVGSSYHETGDFIINNISGHRDGNDSSQGCTTTACPGNSFYPIFNIIRNEVAALPCYIDAITQTYDIFHKTVAYPNPCSDYLEIKDDQNKLDNYSLINMDGLSLTIGKSSNRINTASLPTGVYFLVNSGRIVERVIKL